MFTGIVEDLGTVERVERRPDALRLTVRSPRVLNGTVPGDSIAVNGCCLTVASVQPGEGTTDEAGDPPACWTADVMAQTLELTALRGMAAGDRVNLERAVTPATRLGGHLVQGHVDGVGRVLTRAPSEHWELLSIELPARLARYVVDQGSIAVDGVSLTVASTTPPVPSHAVDEVTAGGQGTDGADGADGGTGAGGAEAASFTVSLIPETLTRTTLGLRRPGDAVNLEVDVLAKYVEKLLGRTNR